MTSSAQRQRLAEQTMDTSTVHWHPHLDCYPELAALTFLSDDDFRAGLNQIWTNDHLTGVPWDLIGARTMVLPRPAIGFLSNVAFQQTPVIGAGALTAAERAELHTSQPYRSLLSIAIGD